MAESYESTIEILLQSRGKREVEDDARSVEQQYKRVQSALDKAYTSPRVKAEEYMDSMNRVQDIIKSMAPAPSLDKIMKSGLPQIDLNGMIPEFETVDFEKILDASSGQAIKDTLTQVETLISRINASGVNPIVQDKVLNNLEYYRDLLSDVNQNHKNLADEGGTKIEGFLNRYKYSLSLIGLALAGIYGLSKYSQTFGSALDVIGQSLGYLADSLLYMLIPLVMAFAELIIGLTDWFNALPDPIKDVLSALALLGMGVYLFGGTIMKVVGHIRTLIGSLGLLNAAGELTAAGLITGIIAGLLVGFAVVYALIQTGILNAIAKIGQTLQSQYPALVDFIGAFLGPLGMLGVLIVDLVSGQIDKIPEHMRIAAKMTANSFVALGARILEFTTGLLGPQISWLMQRVADLGMMYGSQIKNIGSMGDAIHDAFNGGKMAVLGFIESFSKIPFIGDQFKDVSEWAKKAKADLAADSALSNSWVDAGSKIEDYWKRFSNNSDSYVSGSKDRWKSLAGEFEGYNRDAFEENLGVFSPGSFLNGMTSQDQIAALLKQQQTVSGSSFDDILKKYGQTTGIDNYNALAGVPGTTSSAVSGAVRAVTEESGGNKVEREFAARHQKAMNDLKTHSKYAHDSANTLAASQQDAILLPSSPAPVSPVAASAQPVQAVTNNYHQTFNIPADQKSARQIADEISRIWNTTSRASRI